MGHPANESGAKAMLWAQLVDMVAQHGGALSNEALEGLSARIGELRGAVPVERRASVARSVARRGLGVQAVGLLGQDDARVAAPALMIAEAHSSRAPCRGRHAARRRRWRLS